MDRASAGVACSLGFESCNIKTFLLLEILFAVGALRKNGIKVDFIYAGNADFSKHSLVAKILF